MAHILRKEGETMKRVWAATVVGILVAWSGALALAEVAGAEVLALDPETERMLEAERRELRELEEKRRQAAEVRANLDNALAQRREGGRKLSEASPGREKKRAAGGPVKEKQALIRELDRKVRRDQEAIIGLGLYERRDPETRARDFAAWEELPEKAKIESEEEVLEALLQAAELEAARSAVHGARKAAGPVRSPAPAAVEKRIARLRAKGMTDPRLFEAMRAVAGSPGESGPVDALFRRLQAAAEAAVAPGTAAGSRRGRAGGARETLSGLGSVLGLFWPRYMPLAAELRATAASAYYSATAGVSQSHVESLTRLTDKQLKELKELTARLESDMKRLNDEREKLARPAR
jgi:hypothetical protein